MTLKNRTQTYYKNWAAQVKEDLQVERGRGDGEDTRIWSNQDLDPTPPHKRTWHWWNYLLYFVGTGFNNWQGGSAVIGVGLGWQAAIAIAYITQSISGIVQALNSKAAARYHLGFPAIARSVYGMWGSTYQVAVRSILAAVWYATKTYEGASYLNIMMRCIFGHAYTDIPNHVPESIGYTTKDFLCYFLVWMLYTPFLFRRPYQLRNFFTGACLASIPAVFGLFIYCIVKSGGKLGLAENAGSVKMDTSTTAWLVVYAMASSISNGAAYIESVPDVARWAAKPTSVIPATLFCNFLYNPLAAVLGILGTSALQSATGETIWKPWDVMTFILEEHWTSGVRFGVFLLACCWFYLVFAQNISSNMIPFGADISMLWPRYLTMTRGYIIVHLLAWCICPWKIYVSAETFFNFMGAYGIFMGPAVSIMLVEYYLISRGNIFVSSIYIGNSKNPNYWYTGGWNVQAYIAYIFSVGLCFVGFVNKVGATVPPAAEKIGYLAWFLSFTSGGIVYYLVNLVYPHQNVKNVKGRKWEEIANTDDDDIIGVEVAHSETADVEREAYVKVTDNKSLVASSTTD